MEAVTGVRPVSEQETLKTFDPVATVRLFRHDLETVGYVRPETRQRGYDEELTYIAEGINRPLYTKFVLKEVDGELSYFDMGEWKPYTALLLKGRDVAIAEAKEDYRKWFQVDRTVKDLEVGYQFRALSRGERMSWYSPFPAKERELYGDQLLESLGYQPKRRMGFLYLAEKNVDGSITLHTHSVDNSDEEAFAAAIARSEQDEAADIKDMRAAYDAVLAARYGRRIYAGRNIDSELGQDNAWEVIGHHRDLIDYYFKEIEALAARYGVQGEELEAQKKRLTYGVWAALKERIDRGAAPVPQDTVMFDGVARGVQFSIQMEIRQAYRTASRKGEMLLGCGGGIAGKSEDSLLDASAEDVFDLIFGKRNEDSDEPSDKYGPLKFKCPKGHTNTRPRNQLIDECQTCKRSVRC